MARSLLMQHRWLSLFVPCHDQCAMSHGLSTFSHLLTILWLAAVLVVLMAGGNALPTPTKWGIAILSTMLAQPLAPLLAGYYHRSKDSNITISEGSEPMPKTNVLRRPGETKSSRSAELAALAAAVQSTQVVTAVDVSGLDDIELGESLSFGDEEKDQVEVDWDLDSDDLEVTASR